jgi:methionyl-tRNA formyltransferase
MRIVLIAPEEPSVMPVFFEQAVPRLRDEIAAVAVVSPIYKRSSWLRQARRFIAAFGFRDFVAEAALYARFKLSDAIHRLTPAGSYHSVKSIARAEGLPLLTPRDVNSPEFLDALRGLAPDLIVSVSCPQIFREELLRLPSRGCINVHSARLPKYRGVLPTFWALAQGERETGVTVHFMAPGIDDGGIIVQAGVPIEPQDTLHSLMTKCKQVAADLVVETVGRFRDGEVASLPNPVSAGSYFSFPERQDVAGFRALGRALR